MRLCSQSVLWFVLAAACSAGCSGEKVPGLGRVRGAVTLDGQPVADAEVIFEAAKPGEPPSMGRTDASGNYELYYSRGHKGATLGEHLVFIGTYQAPTDESPQPKKEKIPAKYNRKSELKVTVGRGTNMLNFDLKSGGPIIQPEEEDATKKGKKVRSKTGCA